MIKKKRMGKRYTCALNFITLARKPEELVETKSFLLKVELQEG
jgi:hypothetical protein